MDKFVLFKPLNDRFVAESGSFEVALECRWHDSKKWLSTRPVLHFELTAPIAKQWNDEAGQAVQVASSELMALRKAFSN